MPRYFNDKIFYVVDELKLMSQDIGKTPSQISLAWLLFDQRVTAVIVSPKNVEQLKDTLEVSEWNLTEEQYERLSGKLGFSHGYPMEWVDMEFNNFTDREEFKPSHYQFPIPHKVNHFFLEENQVHT